MGLPNLTAGYVLGQKYCRHHLHIRVLKRSIYFIVVYSVMLLYFMSMILCVPRSGYVYLLKMLHYFTAVTQLSVFCKFVIIYIVGLNNMLRT